MTSTWLQARIAEKPELADQLNADNVGRKQRLRFIAHAMPTSWHLPERMQRGR